MIKFESGTVILWDKLILICIKDSTNHKQNIGQSIFIDISTNFFNYTYKKRIILHKWMTKFSNNINYD